MRLSNEGVGCRSSVNPDFARLRCGASPELSDRLDGVIEPGSRVCGPGRGFDGVAPVLAYGGFVMSGLFNGGRPI
jgi:hypothetical protein